MDNQPTLPGLPPPSPRTTKPYRPSNGTEGEWFIGWQCMHCARARADDPCEIVTDTMSLAETHPDYPREWVVDLDGANPRCTGFDFMGLE